MSVTHSDNDSISTMFEGIDGRLEQLALLLRAQYEQQKRNVPVPFLANCAVNGFALPRDAQGVIKTIHNTTTAALLVTLNESGSSGGPSIFSGNLAAGESRLVYLPFRSGVYCVSGNGAVLGGDLTRA